MWLLQTIKKIHRLLIWVCIIYGGYFLWANLIEGTISYMFLLVVSYILKLCIHVLNRFSCINLKFFNSPFLYMGSLLVFILLMFCCTLLLRKTPWNFLLKATKVCYLRKECQTNYVLIHFNVGLYKWLSYFIYQND